MLFNNISKVQLHEEISINNTKGDAAFVFNLVPNLMKTKQSRDNFLFQGYEIKSFLEWKCFGRWSGVSVFLVAHRWFFEVRSSKPWQTAGYLHSIFWAGLMVTDQPRGQTRSLLFLFMGQIAGKYCSTVDWLNVVSSLISPDLPQSPAPSNTLDSSISPYSVPDVQSCFLSFFPSSSPYNLNPVVWTRHCV